jgi:prepilin-type N-terminal cleavage/methylation domain-containing protein
MKHNDAGFSMVELLIVIMIIGIIAAFAIPQATKAVYSYRVHADAARLAAQLNITRFRATSQYSPYSLTLNAATLPNSMSVQRLCGSNTTGCGTTTPTCTSQSYTSYQTEGGPQYISQGDSFSTTNPGTVLPGSITAASAATTTFFFNTRGMPVDCNGLPVSSGGAVVYISSSQVAVNDAVVISVAGLVATYQWDPATSQWRRR